LAQRCRNSSTTLHRGQKGSGSELENRCEIVGDISGSAANIANAVPTLSQRCKYIFLFKFLFNFLFFVEFCIVIRVGTTLAQRWHNVGMSHFSSLAQRCVNVFWGVPLFRTTHHSLSGIPRRLRKYRTLQSSARLRYFDS
jgi:hypothetical protein